MKEADHRKPNVDLLGLRSQQSYRASVGACPGLGVGNVLETPYSELCSESRRL